MKTKQFSFTVTSTDPPTQVSVEVTDFFQETCQLCASYDGYWLFLNLRKFSDGWHYTLAELQIASYPNRPPVLISEEDWKIVDEVVKHFSVVASNRRYRSIDEE